MSDRAEWIAHALGGAAMAAVELWVTGSAVLALFWPTLLGYARESEQARAMRKRLEIRTGRRVRPGAFWHWSKHRVSEWLAWFVGAVCAVAAYSAS